MDDTLSLDLQQTDFGAIVEPELERLNKKIDDEESARKDADNVLDGKISGEKNAREDADRLIWAEINTIEIASDVVDIVGTYAALQAYDTSKLQDNDIIKVLKDETHSNATTYYRWNKTASQFSYVGEEGPYYTTSQTDTLLSGKQNTLTAGSNIQISSDVISATDTTYTAGTNVQINGTVISATDTTYTAGTNVRISDNVISANKDATTLYVKPVAGYPDRYNFYYEDTFTTMVTRAEMLDMLRAGNVQITRTVRPGMTWIWTIYDVLEDGDATPDIIWFTSSSYNASNPAFVTFGWRNGDNYATYYQFSVYSYHDFTGTDGTSYGSQGLVPAPVPSDSGKFLKSDGTWDTAGSAANNISSSDWSALWQ